MRPGANRPTNWRFIIAVVGGTVVVGFLFLRTFFFPYQQAKKSLALLSDDYDSQRRDFLLFMKEKKRLDRDRLLGFPRDQAHGISQYQEYFLGLVKACSLKLEEFNPTAGEVKKAAGNQAKKAEHIPVTFQVKVQGSWSGLIKLLETFQRTPLLQRIKSWNAEEQRTEKDSTGKLVVNMTIEALVVNRNEQRPEDLWGLDMNLAALDGMLALRGQPAGWSMILRAQALLRPEMPARRYSELVMVNPFIGGPLQPEANKSAVVASKKSEKPKESRTGARLVLTDFAEQKAILLAATSAEKSSSIKLAANQTFAITEGKTAKVLRVDHRDVFVQVGKEIYRIRIGHTVGEALEQPLPPEEVRNLRLLDKTSESPDDPGDW